MEKKLSLYSSLAKWWPLVSDPKHYEEEAALYLDILAANCKPLSKVLELGSGGGNNASHLKKHFSMTLVDLYPEMIEVSRKLNPECVHIVGDMRKIQLEQEFDAVFVHDAINYMANEEELFKTILNCANHCRSGGVVLIVPDFFKESFKSTTSHGGGDSNGSGVRYLDWIYDPDPDDSSYTSSMVYIVRDGKNPVIVESDNHVCGLFSRENWIKFFKKAGLEPKIISIPHSTADERLAILGKKGIVD